MPETIHCRVRGCNWSARVANFEEGMKKLRHHRRVAHPALHRESIRKGVATRKRRKRNRR